MAEGAGEEKASGGSQPVFVSYASQDTAIANAIVESLERNGLRCWIAPRDVTPGSHYADHIMSAISGAKVLVLVLSDSALASKHVGKEVERASAKGRPIIALRTDTAPLTPAFEYFLSESQWIDAAAGGLAAVATKLVEAVRSHADSTVGTGPAAAPMAAGHSKTLPFRHSVIAAVAVVFAVLVGYLVVDKFWLSKHAANERPVAAVAPATAPAAPAIAEKSVAVLPFVDMSEKKDQEYFSDGLSEELIDMLTKVPDLRVPARTSSFYFKGKQATIADIAKALGVAHVLEGSVRKSGQNLRVTAQLIRVDSGYHVWSETFDRKLDDIFKVQDEIAASVVQALKASLLAPGVSRQGPTGNTEAYSLRLQGRFFFFRGAPGDYERAVDYFERAVRVDPSFAPAWASLARAIPQLPNRPWRELRDRAMRAAERAIALDPTFAEAHLAKGKISLLYDWDWATAESNFRRALALDSGDAGALMYAGDVRLALGDVAGATELYQQSLARDPLQLAIFRRLTQIHLATGHLAEMEATARKLVELSPLYEGAHAFVGWALIHRGNSEAGLTEIARETSEETRSLALAWAYQFLGRKADADTSLAHLEMKYADDDAYSIATLYAMRGERDQAFHWLDRAYEQRDFAGAGNLPIMLDPDWKSLHDDPRYKAYLRKMKLPE